MPNRLAAETSPYLLQHADNPVDWYPWGEAALARARREDKPILLSIGYSACHWCHVMAHECFEDPDVAALMNRHFVNIKVDREERPDLDHIYQAAHQLLAGRGGGWPLTVFLTPQQTPFFAGTYFPRTPRHGLPAFAQVLESVARAWAERRADLSAHGDAVRAALAEIDPAAGGTLPADDGLVAAALGDWARAFDAVWGGFSPAPKFPRAPELAFLLGHETHREMALFTLRKMAEGGLADQIGGGFFRYAVDAQWAIPHFEKMLSDNGLLLACYADAWAYTADPLFARAAEGIVGWLGREMRAPEGGFHAALDADSEGEEGRFYTFTREEVVAALTADEARVALPHFGFDRPPNFEGARWHPVVAEPVAMLAARLGMPPEVAAAGIEAARTKLFALRAGRARPAVDGKILSAWNALAVEGLARAGRLLARPEWVAEALRVTDALRATVWRDGRLLALHPKGARCQMATLDDHAFLLAALIELMQAEFRPADLVWAQVLADALIDHFEDREAGGFFFTAHDHEPLIHRPKPGYDQATPAGNARAVQSLLRVGRILGEARYLQAAERALACFAGAIATQPMAYPGLLAALDELRHPPRIVILRGPAAGFAPWLAKLATRPGRDMVLALANGLDLPAALAKPECDSVTAWVCQGETCRPPLHSPDALA
jgi:uncharacterized protein YyaL (SSP411 family)